MQTAALNQRAEAHALSPVTVRLEGAGVTELFELRDERPLAVIGRSAASDLRLQDPEVSRRHALLVRWRDEIFCLDLGSRIGTRVDSSDTHYGWLSPQHPATIGSYRLVMLGDQPQRWAPPALHRDRLPHDRTHDWQLEFVAGDVQPSRYTLRRPLTLIGRKPFCKIQLKLPKVQSVHAALLATPGGLYLRDLSGRCALRVDGQAWFGGWLRHGQIVELGDVQIRIAHTAVSGTARSPDLETDDPAGGVTLESIGRFPAPVHIGGESSVQTGQPGIAESPGTSSSEQPATPRPLTELVLSGRYQIIKRVARGGMGVVYRGLDQRLHRPVAVKVVRGRSDINELGRQRLLREAMVCSRLDHPYIVRVLDVNKDGRFAVFEFVPGETLGDRLRRLGPLPPVDVSRWVAQIADAIDCMGRQGVVHRDIKPANVLLPNGTAKVLDFGLAYMADAGDCEKLAQLTADTERPRKGIAIGTAPFASPEQFENCLSVDTRSDIYSAGCTLYSVLTGRPPYYGTLPEMYRLHRESPLQPIAGLDPALMSIIDKCLAKSPADRYQTGAELATELRAFAERP